MSEKFGQEFFGVILCDFDAFLLWCDFGATLLIKISAELRIILKSDFLLECSARQLLCQRHFVVNDFYRVGIRKISPVKRHGIANFLSLGNLSGILGLGLAFCLQGFWHM